MDDIKFKWHEIGTALNVPFGELQGLRTNPDTNANRLKSVIHIWYTNNVDPPATWSMVLKAVEGPPVSNLLVGQQIREWLAEEDQFKYYMEETRKEEEKRKKNKECL